MTTDNSYVHDVMIHVIIQVVTVAAHAYRVPPQVVTGAVSRVEPHCMVNHGATSMQSCGK
jgi:hypothetical protein